MVDPENIIAHVSFTTTVAPAAPTVMREWGGVVARNGALVGQYVVTIDTAIADRDLKCIPTIEDGTTWCDVKVSATNNGAVWNVTTFGGGAVWNVTTFGGGVGADIGLLNLAGAVVRLDFVKVNPG